MDELMEAYRSADGNIAANVRAYRELNGWSQEELAQRLEEAGLPFNQTAIWKTETGKRPLRASELIVMAGVLEVSPMTLIIPPEDATLRVELKQANAVAFAAHNKLKEAASNYLKAQLNLVYTASSAHEAGLVVTEADTTWLDIPAEQIVLEVRVEAVSNEDHSDHVLEQVDKIVEALRANGYEPRLSTADVQRFPGGPVPIWTPEKHDPDVQATDQPTS